MKIIYLLPPSEGKNTGGETGDETLEFHLSKPFDIAINATQKDLKCKGKRYEEGIELNKNIENSEKLESISRYSGVMYNVINYNHMSNKGKKYFENNFKILSGMYGLLNPLDTIGNYKLPIETKGLYTFWGDQITQIINAGKYDFIVDLLPISYGKMIDWKNIHSQIIRINFYKKNTPGEKGVLAGRGVVKISHGVKKVKGEYIKNLCEKNIQKIEDFVGEKVQISENEYHINVIS